MNKIFSGLVGLAAILAAAGAHAETVAIVNGQVHTATNMGVIENGTVVIVEDRITAVGAEVAIPNGARVVDAQGRPVTPGFMAPFTQMGMTEISLDSEANDATVDTGFALGAALDVQYAINPDTTVIPVTRIEGVTRAAVVPLARTGVFGGQAAVIHLSDGPDIIAKTDAAMVVWLGTNGIHRAGDSRMALWTELREMLDDAQDYATNERAYQTSRPRDQRFPLADIRALVPVIQGDVPLAVVSDGAAELRQVIRLKNEYDLDVFVISAREGWLVADELAAADIPVIIDPIVNFPSDFETMASTQKNAARLHEAGVKIALMGADVGYTHNARLLAQMAGNAVAHGLPWDAALAAVTRNPAEIWGVDDSYGSLAPGKDADVVVWSGDPFELSSRPTNVFVRGAEAPLESRVTKLRDRYRDLERGDLPFGYRR